jgi:hypothetical protein
LPGKRVTETLFQYPGPTDSAVSVIKRLQGRKWGEIR